MGRCVVSSEGAQDLRQLVSAELGRSAATRREGRKSYLGHVSPPSTFFRPDSSTQGQEFGTMRCEPWPGVSRLVAPGRQEHPNGYPGRYEHP